GEIDKRTDHIVDNGRIDDGLERDLAAVDVPAAKDGAFGIPGGFVDAAISAGETTIRIGDAAGVEQGVVEGRIKDRLFLFRAAGDVDLPECGTPTRDRLP